MTDEQTSRTYSEKEVAEIVRQSVMYAILDLDFIRDSDDYSSDERAEEVAEIPRIPFARDTEIAYVDCYAKAALMPLMKRMKAKGIDTTHLE
ncbi:MAG: hypothetical protein AABY16_02850 [Nanoarchaeota archaeon]